MATKKIIDSDRDLQLGLKVAVEKAVDEGLDHESFHRHIRELIDSMWLEAEETLIRKPRRARRTG